MNINLAPIDEEYIKSKVEAGYYTNFAEGVRDAVRKMRETDEQYNQFVAAARLGKEQNDKGLGRPYTAETLQRIEQNARARAARGEKPNPDVLP